jgi:outer membrane immunogenic protein
MRNKLISSLAGAAFSFAASGFAVAADMAVKMPVKAPPPAPAPVYSWTGFYIGGNIGGGWGHRHVTFTPNDPATANLFFVQGFGPPPTSFTSSGVIGGGQIGYNWQWNQKWLVGLETDFDGTNIRGATTANFGNSVIPFSATVDEHLKWLGTIRGRLGYLPTETLLAYIAGGFAYGRLDHTGTYTNNSIFAVGPVTGGGFAIICFGGPTCAAGSSGQTATGWTLGGGLEYALTQNLSVRAEYLYVSLDTKPLTETALSTLGAGIPASFNANYGRLNLSVVRAGLNYQFH